MGGAAAGAAVQVVGSGVGAVIQSRATRAAANKQIAASKYASDIEKQIAEEQMALQKEFWERAQADFKPYLDLGHEGVSQLYNVLPQVLDTTLQPYSQAFREFQLTETTVNPYTGLVETPELQTSGWQGFNPQDPVFQSKLDIVNQQTDAWLAKQGLLGSTAGQTIKNKAVQGLVNEEVDKQYQRDINEREAQNKIALQQYGIETGAGEQLYGRMTEERARQIENDQRRLGLMAQQYGIDESLLAKRYGMASDWAKYGQSAAGATGSLGPGYATNMAAIQGNLASNLGNAALAQGSISAGATSQQGQTWGQAISSIGQLIGNYYGAQQPQQFYNQSRLGSQPTGPDLGPGNV